MKAELLREIVSPECGLNVITESTTPKKGVLRTLAGPFADFVNDTRNGRFYEKSLWTKILNSPTTKEMFETKTFFGEADHPQNRLEVSLPHVSHNITKLEIDEGSGHLMGEMDILDTPSGRILNTLVDYGSKIGVSSRGAGRVVSRAGRNIVDTESYKFITFDAVPMPANKPARMNESIDDAVEVDTSIIPDSVLSVMRDQVTECISSSDYHSLEVIKPLLEGVNHPEVKPLVESIDHALEIKGTTIDPSVVMDELGKAYKLISELQESINNHQDQLKELSEKINEPKSDLSSTTTDNDGTNDTHINEEFDNLRIENTLLIEKCSNLQFIIDETKKHEIRVSESLKDELHKTQQSLKESIKTINELKIDISNKDSDILSIREQLELSNNQLIEVNESSSTITEELNENYDSLKSEYNILSESLDVLQNQVQIAEPFIEGYLKARCSQLLLDFKQVRPLISEGCSFDEANEILKNVADKSVVLSKIPTSSRMSTNPKQVILESTTSTSKQDKDKCLVDKDIISRVRN